MGSEEDAIRRAHSIFIEAVNAGAVDQLLSLMTDDAVLLGPGQSPLRRDNFPALHTAAHEQARIRCTSELEEIVVAGEFAYTRCRDSASARPYDGGEAMEFAGYRLSVWRKQSDGRWLLARDAHTLTPVAKPAL